MNAPLFRTLTLLLTALPIGGCASQTASVSALPPLTAAARAHLGNSIGVTTPRAPARFSFEPASGRTGTADDGAVEGMKTLARSSGSGEGAMVVVALLPVAALVGAIAETGKVLSPEELKKSEGELRAGLLAVAEQSEFREQFLSVARGRTNVTFVQLDTAPTTRGEPGSRPPSNYGAEWMLELSVVDLRLQRTSLTDASYALFVNARIRLLGVADGTVAYDEPINFRSGTSLFVNWTFDRGAPLRRVTETGYRMLAEQIVERLIAAP